MNTKERGYTDTDFAAYNMDTTGTLTLLNIIPQGTTVNDRVGKKVKLLSIQMRGYAIANAGSAITNDVAVIFVYDRRPRGALPAITDVLETANATALNQDSNSGRFKILKRIDMFLLGSSAGGANSGSAYAQSVDCYTKLKELPYEAMAAGTGVIADINTGALYMITVGSAAAGTTAATLNATIRVRFVDY